VFANKRIQNTCAQCDHDARSGIQFRQTQKAICKETGLAGPVISAGAFTSAAATAGSCQSA
jgi:hypothetical protein